MKNIRSLKSIIFLTIILSLIACSKKQKFQHQNSEKDIYFIEYGVLFKVSNDLNINFIGSFNPASPTVERSPDGLFWARIDDNHIGAMNPDDGKIVADIKLPFRPYNHIITPGGKAYITHNTLVKDGFTISVVDTNKRKFIREIKGIQGLRTSIIYHKNYIYLATMGFKFDEYLRLYRINTKNDRLEEMYKERLINHVLLLASSSDKILIFASRPLPNSLGSLDLYALSPSKNTMEKMKLKIHRPISQITGKPLSSNGRIYLPVVFKDGHSVVVVVDPENYKVVNEYPVNSTIYKIICIKKDLLLYLDNPLEVGSGGVSLWFYDTIRGREVKHINLLNFLRSGL